jgi:hypothetical protein
MFNQIPSEIAAIITDELDRQGEEALSKAQREQEEKAANLQKGGQLVREYIASKLDLVPIWLRPYVATVLGHNEDQELEAVGRYGMRGQPYLEFKIPGLSPIIFRPDLAQYWCLLPGRNDFDERKPGYFSSSEKDDLKAILVVAKLSAEKMAQLQSEYEKFIADGDARRQAWEEKERLQNQVADHLREQEETESANLLDFVKKDPAATLLLKAFVAVRQERQGFELQIAGLDEGLATAEAFWQRKADELRNQAKEADRRAEEERSKARDIEDDLSKAEKKLKATERGW